MAINFPSNPVKNQTYTNGTKVWVYDGALWKSTDSARTPVATVSGSAPTSAVEGQMWVDSETGILNTYVGGGWVGMNATVQDPVNVKALSIAVATALQ